MSKGSRYSTSKGSDSTSYGNQRAAYTENNGVRHPKNLISIPVGGDGKFHPTQKPVKLMEYFIKTYTNPGDTVLDFAMGSGTTGVACGRLGRKFIGMELNSNYFMDAEARIKAAYKHSKPVKTHLSLFD